MNHPLSAALSALGEQISYLQEMGVSEIESSKKVRDDPHTALAHIRQRIGDCQRCPLHEKRRSIVFGSGNPSADLVFVGEAPGEEEDLSGLPFVGRAGQLLTRMIEAMGMSREEVYIANIVKCRPPGNRPPTPEEIATCSPFLWAQLDAIHPTVICALGTFAAHTLLSIKTPITQIRGTWHTVGGIMVIPTFHPAYLLRNPHDKRLAWEDMQKILTLLGKTSQKTRKNQ